VSPFGLINDRAHGVRVVIDRDLAAADRLAFHPNINTATLVVSTGDFSRFLDACGNSLKYVGV
jgi:Ala-tRNA(Pro) deacylase